MSDAVIGALASLGGAVVGGISTYAATARADVRRNGEERLKREEEREAEERRRSDEAQARKRDDQRTVLLLAQQELADLMDTTHMLFARRVYSSSLVMPEPTNFVSNEVAEIQRNRNRHMRALTALAGRFEDADLRQELLDAVPTIVGAGETDQVEAIKKCLAHLRHLGAAARELT